MTGTGVEELREAISEVLLYREGSVDTIAIVRKDYGFFDPDAKSLITNGVAMSATVKPVWRYMAKDALNGPQVTAVEEFRKTINESEKQRQQKP
jgi:hypothetical protein